MNKPFIIKSLSTLAVAGFVTYLAFTNVGKVREERVLAIKHVGNTSLVYTQEDKAFCFDNYVLNIIDENNNLRYNYNIKKGDFKKAVRKNNLTKKLERGKR